MLLEISSHNDPVLNYRIYAPWKCHCPSITCTATVQMGAQEDKNSQLSWMAYRACRSQLHEFCFGNYTDNLFHQCMQNYTLLRSLTQILHQNVTCENVTGAVEHLNTYKRVHSDFQAVASSEMLA